MKKILKITLMLIILMIFASMTVQAKTNTTKMEKILSKYKNIDVDNISDEELESIYNEAIESYDKEELSNMIKENKEKLEEQGVSSETIEKGAEFIKTTDDDKIKEILKGTDIKSLIKRVQKGESVESAMLNSQKDLNKTMLSGMKIILSSYIVKVILIFIVVYVCYKIIIRGIIYKKAGKHFIATFIPIYRDIVLFKICGYSPWIMLFLLLPVIGWIIYLVYKILMKFELAMSFGHGVGFGIGVWLLNPIFESIIAFSKNEYITEKIN